MQQAQSLDAILAEFGLEIVCVLNFKADRGELLKRLTGRRTCRRCGATFHIHFKASRRPNVCDVCGGELVQRNDDNEESVSRRLDAFERETRPLLEHYGSQGLLIELDAEGQIYDVQLRVREIVNSLERRLNGGSAPG